MAPAPAKAESRDGDTMGTRVSGEVLWSPSTSSSHSTSSLGDLRTSQGLRCFPDLI